MVTQLIKTDCGEKHKQPQICRWYHFNSRKWRGIKEHLVESERAGLKFNIQKTKIMASGPITLQQIDGEHVKTVTDFIFLGSKIIADGDCSLEIKRRLLLGRIAMRNLDRVVKRRDISLLTKVCIVNAMIFPVVMYGCECWLIKKAELLRIDAFKLVLEKIFESPLDCNQIKVVSPKGNQTWIFIGRTDAEAEAPILWPPDAKNWLIWKDPDAGKDWRWKEKGIQRNRWLDGITGSMDTSLRKLREDNERQGSVLQSMGSQRIGHDLAIEQQQQKPCRQVSTPGILMTEWERLAIRLTCVLYIILMWNKSCFTSWCSCFLFPWLWIAFLFLWSTALFLSTCSGKPDDPPLPHCTHSPSFHFPGHHQ